MRCRPRGTGLEFNESWIGPTQRERSMTKSDYLLVSGTLFALVSIAHLVRLIFQLPVLVEDYAVPMYVSWIGFIVPALLAAWAFRLRSQ